MHHLGPRVARKLRSSVQGHSTKKGAAIQEPEVCKGGRSRHGWLAVPDCVAFHLDCCPILTLPYVIRGSCQHTPNRILKEDPCNYLLVQSLYIPGVIWGISSHFPEKTPHGVGPRPQASPCFTLGTMRWLELLGAPNNRGLASSHTHLVIQTFSCPLLQGMND